MTTMDYSIIGKEAQDYLRYLAAERKADSALKPGLRGWRRAAYFSRSHNFSLFAEDDLVKKGFIARAIHGSTSMVRATGAGMDFIEKELVR